MRRFPAARLALLGLATLSPRHTMADGAPSALRVATTAGVVVGSDSAGVRRWLAIPYAAPPVGALRWRPPANAPRWNGDRPATTFGPACIQNDRLSRLYGGAMDPISEDCLTLNVWSGAAGSARRPVMVWIHGGGFNNGSTRTPIYDGTRLAQLGAVVVTINYRLGLFGYLAHPALSAESPRRASGHYGFLDQVAALQWVRREIARFGGDPNNVTIFGESAGAFSVGYHLVSPLSRGLFHRAILQSGSPMRFPLPLAGPDGTRSGEAIGLALASRVGVAGRDAGAVAALRAISADSLLRRFGDESVTEVVDGEFLVEPPSRALLAGRVARVPVLIGSNADESTILVRELRVRTAPQLDSAIRASYPAPFAERAVQFYPPGEGAMGPARTYRTLWTDDVFTAPARETARALARTGTPVFRYWYTRVGGGMMGLALGAFHASEIPFVFGVRSLSSNIWGTTPGDSGLADAMSGAWTRFALQGDPNGGPVSGWAPVTSAGDETFEFGARVGPLVQPVRPSQLDFLGEVLAFRSRNGATATVRADVASPPAAPAAGERLIVLNKAEASASVLDLASGKVIGTLPVGDGPHEVAVRADGRLAVACNYGTGPAPGRSLTVLDLEQMSVVRTIDLGEYRRPHGIAFLADGRTVVVTVEANQAVLLVDIEQGVVTRAIRTEQQGTHLLVTSRDGARAYTANLGSGSVSLLDLVAGTRVRTTVTGKFPEAIDLSPDGRWLWTADRTLEKVTIIDAATLDTVRSLPTGQFPNRLKFTPDGRRALVSNALSSTLGFYDAVAGRADGELRFEVDPALVRPQMLGSQMAGSAVPLGILMDPTGARAWVALAAMDRIAEVDLSTRTVRRLLQAGREPDGMALIPARR